MTNMAERMLNLIKQGPCTIVELADHLGRDDVRGDYSIELGRDNLFVWAGASKEFVDAFFEIRPFVEPHPCHWLVYFLDGCLPSMPLVKGIPPKRGYKKPHWMPVTLHLRSEASKKRFQEHPARESERQCHG